MSQTSGFEPEQAPVFDHDTNMPYAKRTVSFFFWAVLAVIAVVFFTGWYMSNSSDEQNVAGVDVVQSEESGNSVAGAINSVVSEVAEGAAAATAPGLNAGLELERAKQAYATAPTPEIVAPLDNKDDVNMRLLENAQIIDFEGNLTGEVDAVIYKDKDVEHIYFELQPAIAPQEQPRVYSLPYEDANIMEAEDGTYKILLNEEQTAAVASILLQE